MMSLASVFWLFLIVFAVIGGFRGWAKEILVAFSVIAALALDTMLTKYLPGTFGKLLNPPEPSATAFYIRLAIVLTMAYFGYQTPNLPGFGSGKFAREKLQDWLLGSMIGMINGYLIVGTLWAYLAQAGYKGVEGFITAPTGTVGQLVSKYLEFMPPVVFGFPNIVFAVIIAFVFVIIVFV